MIGAAELLEVAELVEVGVAAAKCRGYRAATKAGSSSPWEGMVFHGEKDGAHLIVDQYAMSVYLPDGMEWHNTNVARYLVVGVTPSKGALTAFADQEFEGFTHDGAAIA